MRKARRIKALIAGTCLAVTGSFMASAIAPGAAGAAMVSHSGPAGGLTLGVPMWNTCSYKVWWDQSGATKSVTVYGPSVKAPAGQTVYYRPSVFDTVTRSWAAIGPWTSSTMGSTAVRFADRVFNFPFTATHNLHDQHVYLEIRSYLGNVQKASMFWKMDSYRIYGKSGFVGTPEGALMPTC